MSNFVYFINASATISLDRYNKQPDLEESAKE